MKVDWEKTMGWLKRKSERGYLLCRPYKSVRKNEYGCENE